MNIYNAGELRQFDDAAKKLPSIICASRGYIKLGQILTNAKDFSRVTKITPFEKTGVTLTNNGFILIDVSTVTRLYKSSPLLKDSKEFDYKDLREKLLKKGGKEEKKNLIRIKLPFSSEKLSSTSFLSAKKSPPSYNEEKISSPTFVLSAASFHAAMPTHNLVRAASMPTQSLVTAAKAPLAPLLGFDWSKAAQSCGIAALSGFVMAFVDEILDVIPNEKLRLWLRRIINTASLLVGIGFLINALLVPVASILTTLAVIIAQVVSGYISFKLSKLFFRGVKKLFAWFRPDEPIVELIIEAPTVEAPIIEAAVVGAPVVDAPIVDAPAVEPPIVEAFVAVQPFVLPPLPPVPNHLCNVSEGYLFTGKCCGCWERVARFGFVHRDSPDAHVALCDVCMDEQQRRAPGYCVCNAEASSMFHLNFPVCPNQNCIEVGLCRRCDEPGNLLATARYWRNREVPGQEPQLRVDLCEQHMQTERAMNHPYIRYGGCFGLN